MPQIDEVVGFLDIWMSPDDVGDLLAERFGIEHVWVDLPNPV
jgi:hypothetical protein